MLDTYYTKYPELTKFFQEDRAAPKSTLFTNSIIYNPTHPRWPGNATEFGFDCGSCNLTDIQGTDDLWLVRAPACC